MRAKVGARRVINGTTPWAHRREDWAFFSMTIVVAAEAVLLFGSLYPNLLPFTQPGLERDDLQRLVNPLHAENHDVGIADPRTSGHRYQAWTYWAFGRASPRTRYPPPSGCHGAGPDKPGWLR